MRQGPISRNLTSLKALSALLDEIILNPVAFVSDELLIAALRSQGSLSKFKCDDRGISASSLNTQKRLSQTVFTDGYAHIESRRRKALYRVGAVRQANAKAEKSGRTVAGLSNKAASLKALLLTARQDCFHLTEAFVAALREGTNAVEESGDPSMIAKWQKTRKVLLARVTLTSRDYSRGPGSDTDA